MINSIVKFEGIELNVDFEAEEIWATQDELGRMYRVTRENITIHINNIYSSGELESGSTCKDSLRSDSLGRTRKIKEYNLDMILSLGYRINSDVAMRFRQFSNELWKRELKPKIEPSPLDLAEQMLLALKSQDSRISEIEDRLDNTPISIDGQKEGHLHSLLSSYGKRIGNYSVGYNKFYEHYKIGSYKQLPLRLYSQAIELVESWHRQITSRENRLF